MKSQSFEVAHLFSVHHWTKTEYEATDVHADALRAARGTVVLFQPPSAQPSFSRPTEIPLSRVCFQHRVHLYSPPVSSIIVLVPFQVANIRRAAAPPNGKL